MRLRGKAKDPYSPESYDSGSYGLSAVLLDGTPVELSAVYPSGAGLYLDSTGSALLILGENVCTAEWTEQNGTFWISFGEMTGTGAMSGDTVTFAPDGTGLEYLFSRGEAAPLPGENRPAPADPVSGAWHGRIWFESPEGEWADWEYRTMELTGTAEMLPAPDGTSAGELKLFSPWFSESEPFLRVAFAGENGAYHSTDGVLLSYPVHEFEMNMELTEELQSGLRDTVIIEKPGDYGHVFTAEPKDPDAEEPLIPVLRLSGTCRDAGGSFSYIVELVR